MTKPPSDPAALPLHEVVRGLILLSGLSTQETAVRAGVSPGAVAAWSERAPDAYVTWSRMLAALGAGVVVEAQGKSWPIAMAKPGAQRCVRAWDAWRHRRVAAKAALARPDAKLKRTEAEERARAYAANEEERLRARFTERRAAFATLGGNGRAAGPRDALRLVADKAEVNAEELSLLAGCSLNAAQRALNGDDEGRLAVVQRILSALNARLRVTLPAGRVDIALCEPGDWRPSDKPAVAVRVETPKPITNRSRLDVDELLALFDQGLSIGAIARKAGVSRQRVHKIAMDHGRAGRRATARDQRIAAGRDLLQN